MAFFLLFFKCFIIPCRKFGIVHCSCTYILRESVMKVDWGGGGGGGGRESFAMPGNQTWFSIVPGFLVLCSTELTCPISSIGILLFGFILFPHMLACSWHQSAIDSFGLLGRKWQCSQSHIYNFHKILTRIRNGAKNCCVCVWFHSCW